MNKLFHPRHISALSLLLATFYFLQGCGSTKAVDSGYITTGPSVSYEKDVSPIIARSCSPCHFPPDGKKEALDSYASVKDNIDYILSRVQLPEDHMKFMPFKNKKPSLSKEEIDLLKRWAGKGFAK